MAHRPRIWNRLPAAWRQRGPALDAWVERYGADEAPRIEAFLRLVAFSFLTRSSDWPCLAPDDRPLEIYRANYQDGSSRPDTLEWEHFRLELASEYGVEWDDGLTGCTLAEIYSRARQGGGDPAPPATADGGPGEPPRVALARRTSSELVCLPFLDTDTAAEVPLADAILAARGYPRVAVRLLRRLAAVGLWHQLLLGWEWGRLDLWDVVQGYALLLAPVGLGVALAGWHRAGLGLLAVAAAAYLGAFGGMVLARREERRAADRRGARG